MSLIKLEASDIRNIESATLTPAQRLNFLVGPNASGKTSILEAIYILGRARSFRTTQAQQLIRSGQAHLTVSGRAAGAQPESSVPIGVRIARGSKEMHLQGRPVQSSIDLIRAFPVQIIHPASIELLEGAPKQRRQFLDWGAFHGEPDYLDPWRRYVKALSQRNSLLRERRIRELMPWNHELARYGKIVASSRQRYVAGLEPVLRETAEHFLPERRVEIQLNSGWNTERPLDQVFEEDIETDLRQGYTQSGPHKGDFVLRVEGRPAKHFLSRGQMKLLVYALLLAQAQLITKPGTAGCVLIDDVASELDQTNKARLLEYIRGRHSQYFVTATEEALVKQAIDAEAAVFEVRHGKVTQA